MRKIISALIVVMFVVFASTAIAGWIKVGKTKEGVWEAKIESSLLSSNVEDAKVYYRLVFSELTKKQLIGGFMNDEQTKEGKIKAQQKFKNVTYMYMSGFKVDPLTGTLIAPSPQGPQTLYDGEGNFLWSSAGK